MDNSTATLSGVILLVNQLELIAPTTVSGTLYGISLVLFCLYVYALLPRLQDDDRKSKAKFMLLYSAIIMICGLYDLVANAWVTEDAFIKHGNYPGGPHSYVDSTLHTPVIVATLTCQWVIDILTSAIQIWRVWVTWSATRYAKLIVVLPLLCFLTFAALSLRTLIFETTLPLPKVVQLDAKVEVAGSIIQGATTILCTTLISLFLVFHHWQARRLIGEAQGLGYIKIVAMLVESYALESIWVLIVTLILSQPVAVFFTETQTYIQIIAYLLVQYRVARGTAYESQRGQTCISSLRWNNRATIQFEEGSHYGRDHQSVSVKTGNIGCATDL